MTTDDLEQRIIDLTDRILQTTSCLDLPRGDWWPSVVAVFLYQANERLESVRLLLDENKADSATILVRSLFELAVNLAYIDKDTAQRLNKYLRHGCIPLNDEQAERLQQEIEEELEPKVPRGSWKPLRDMCADLGPDWLKEYDTFYRYVSVPTHAGAFTLARDFVWLLEGHLPSARERTVCLITASAFHLRVAEIAARTFPDHINHAKVIALMVECSELITARAEERA